MNEENDNIEELEIESEDRGDEVEAGEAGEAEAVAIDTPEPAEEKPTAPEMIPKARLNEVIEQRRAAEELAARLSAENEALKAQKVGVQVDADFDFDSKEQAAMDALMEGDADAYKKIRAEIRAAERQEAARITETAFIARKESDALKEVASNAVEKYPFLDKETGDDDAKREVIEWRDFYMAKGLPASKALQQAVDKVGPMYAKGTADIGATKDTRKPAAIARNAAASEAQGPDLSKSGVGERATAGRINVNRMTDEEFDALPLAEQKRLRGD